MTEQDHELIEKKIGEVAAMPGHSSFGAAAKAYAELQKAKAMHAFAASVEKVVALLEREKG